METTPTQIRDRLGLLADLACGFLESGQSGWSTKQVLSDDAKALGLDGFHCTTVGRVVIVEAHLPDGSNVTVTTCADALDLIDCGRSLRLHRLAARLRDAGDQASGRLDDLREEVRDLRAAVAPWWAVTVGTTLLAFVIAMQLGVGWQAWVTASAVQVVTALAGQLLGRLHLPHLFTIAVQSSVAGAVATVLVKAGAVDPVGAAAAIAVNWLLLIPLPQIIGAMNDIIDADYLTAVTRTGSVAVTGLGITIGGALTFQLGELLHMEHPLLDELPGLPWYFALVFSALGAIGNALANGGWLKLLVPATVIGVITGAVNQALSVAAGFNTLWANAGAAIVLGAVSMVMARRTGYPQHVFALMGITGALLPGIAVVSGILLQMGGQSGAAQFGGAATICVALGTGVAFGAFLTQRLLRLPARP